MLSYSNTIQPSECHVKSSGFREAARGAGLAAALLGASASGAAAQSLEQLQLLSIEDLGKVEVTSVSKRSQPLSDAAASVYVISHEDIMRSGATSLPEILRLAPNLQVQQLSPSNDIITSRGFSGNVADQNFSNKLLVLIDGRSVYTPLYSGVYWDMQEVMPEDIERIEIISGPGATLWGANAVNGVISITTRKAADTQGGSLEVGFGNLERLARLQYGGRLDDDLSWRVYAEGVSDSAFDTPAGGNAHDGWTRPQGGFRVDWSPPGDTVTLQGDLYAGTEKQLEAPDQIIGGKDLVARWQSELGDGSTLQVQAYDDWTRRSVDNGGGAFVLDTRDLDVQHSFRLADWDSIVWGAGDRFDWYRIDGHITPVTSLLFQPAGRTLQLANVFAEDHLSLGDSVTVTFGLKLEDDPYSGLAPMPSGSLLWKPAEGQAVWASIARAIRSPTPFDDDVVEKLGPITYLRGNPDFEPETVTTYETGYRGQLSPAASLSVTLFDDVYGDLKTIEPTPAVVIPFRWSNFMEGHVRGVEAWASWRVAAWWSLTAGASIQHESLRFAPGASGLLGLEQAGDDPHHQASLRSSMAFGEAVTLDADLRYVGALPAPRLPDYAELNTRLGWRISDRLTVSISGFNLLHAQHLEFPASEGADAIKRSVFLDTIWKF